MKEMITRSTMDLQLRKKPQQVRAQHTYEKILAVTATLLDEVGFAGVNTNLIAERAGVNISSIYKFFPNKHAILSTLLIRLNDRYNTIILEYLDAVDDKATWQEIFCGIVDAMVDGTRQEKGLIALQSTMLSTPGFKEICRKSNEDLSSVLLGAIEKCGIRLPNERKDLINACIGEIVPAMLDLSVSNGERVDPCVIEELKRMQIGYISTYVDPTNYWFTHSG